MTCWKVATGGTALQGPYWMHHASASSHSTCSIASLSLLWFIQLRIQRHKKSMNLWRDIWGTAWWGPLWLWPFITFLETFHFQMWLDILQTSSFKHTVYVRHLVASAALKALVHKSGRVTDSAWGGAQIGSQWPSCISVRASWACCIWMLSWQQAGITVQESFNPQFSKTHCRPSVSFKCSKIPLFRLHLTRPDCPPESINSYL